MNNKRYLNNTEKDKTKKNNILILTLAGVLVGVIIVFTAIGIYNFSKIIGVQKKQENDIEIWEEIKKGIEYTDAQNLSDGNNDESDLAIDGDSKDQNDTPIEKEEKQKQEIIIGGDIAGVIKYQNETVIPFYKKGSDVDKGATIFSDVFPGEEGRAVILGHRDQSFYDLKYLKKNDVIKFEVIGAEYKYKVIDIDVVDPDDIPLSETNYSNITLVTCYPFRYIGSAPERYVVQLKKVS